MIEEAATELFARQGYMATSVEDIVSAAGVTKPMLYRHFESKRDLCIALLERYRDELVGAPLAVFDPAAKDRRAQIAPMIEAWLEHARQHPAATRLLFTPITGDAQIARVQRDLWLRQRATQIALLREFVPDLPDDVAEPLGEIARTSLAAVALWWFDHPDVRPEVPVEALSRFTAGLIGAPIGPSSGVEPCDPSDRAVGRAPD